MAQTLQQEVGLPQRQNTAFAVLPQFGVGVFFSTSGTWTCGVNGYYRIGVLSGAGSGAAIFSTTTGVVTGGQGGQFAEKEAVYITAGTILTITVGAGGAGVTSSVNGTPVAGNAGGQSSVVGGPVNIVVPGGAGGAYSTTNGTPAAATPAALPTGGDINFAGGMPGTVACVTGQPGNASGGGGAGSPNGPGGASGNVSGASAATITGGGAINGNASGNASGGGFYSGGAGTGGPSPTATGASTAGGPNAAGQVNVTSVDGVNRSGLYAFDQLINPFRALTGGGSAAASGATGNAGPGAGSGATTTINGVGKPGLLGGSGALNAGGPATGTSGTLGGASGGVGSSVTGPAVSGSGGQGLVTIERIG